MDAFGINLKILIAQIINFGIVLFLLKKFAYRPILSMLETRSKTIREGLDNAEKAKQNLEKAGAKAKEIHEEAYQEAKQIAAETKVQAEKSAKEIVSKAESQAERIIKLAQEEASTAKDKALAEARNHVGNIVVLALEKIIGNELDNAQKEKLTAKTISDLYK